ncbi:hypothetical protein DFP72DRAFT_840481 [Ephemerocybe angulata]|uniref:Uncharacterized protein n=1 Tax=Ephemerocybe angulata TaxID=980116 RepID=A0A8H6MG98_9AGAR|nr:hypothetical protein DFP72DRAFT_840481 [Tulosesus angulatus]
MARTPTDYDNRHLVALYDLLLFVSPTLEVLRLCYVAKCTRSFEDQFPRLPKLRELSVHFMDLSFVGPGPRYLRDSDSDDDSDDEDNSDFDDFDDEEEEIFPLLNKFDVFGVLHFSPFRYWDTLESAAPLLEGLTVPRSQVRVNEHFGFVVGDESESEKDALREVNTSSAWLNNTRTDRRFMAIDLHDEACGAPHVTPSEIRVRPENPISGCNRESPLQYDQNQPYTAKNIAGWSDV